jgi:hypothetical protein
VKFAPKVEKIFMRIIIPNSGDERQGKNTVIQALPRTKIHGSNPEKYSKKIGNILVKYHREHKVQMP